MVDGGRWMVDGWMGGWWRLEAGGLGINQE